MRLLPLYLLNELVVLDRGNRPMGETLSEICRRGGGGGGVGYFTLYIQLKEMQEHISKVGVIYLVRTSITKNTSSLKSEEILS